MANVPITLKSPLPPTDLRFDSMTYSAGLSTLEETRLHMLSEKSDIKAEKLLGQKVEVAVELRDGAKRYFCGYVTRFGLGRNQGRYFGYEATVRPWLWFLTRTTDCRIFQNQTVKEIVETVLADHSAVAKFEFKLDRQYRKRVYCVQYRESDFNFIARLLEDEGIYWYFEHVAGEHKAMFVDGAAAHTPVPGYERLPYYANIGQVPPDTDYISNWNFSRSVETGKTALTSYDFERPSTKLLVKKELIRAFDQADHERFDYQGDYIEKPDGTQLADNRIDEQQSHHEQLSGATNAHGMKVGHLFNLKRHPRDDQNAEYLCVQTRVTAQVNSHEAGNAAGDYQCGFAAMPSSQQFRPPRRTPRPFVQGPQTAVVVGPSGDEIFTDKYGRVKVQFHWDRLGTNNEKSSCWLRVSSPWAGKSFGFIQVPRIGQEVVVDFLEGDPDQPLITGRVYNAEQMPPWDLPANATQSGVLSRSSKGGAYGNANALRFEDKKGSEQVWLHAEKNQDIEVENDETHWVGHDRSKTIDHDETVHVKHDRTETVDNNETITIGVDRTEMVGNNETLTVLANRRETIAIDHIETIGANMTITVGSMLTETVGINYSETVGGAMELTVGAAMAITVGGALAEVIGLQKSETIGGAKSESIGANRSMDVGGDSSETVVKNKRAEIQGDMSEAIGGKRNVSVNKEFVLTAKKIQLVADDEIQMKTGSAELILKRNGDITIKGIKVNVKASGDITLKGATIKEN